MPTGLLPGIGRGTMGVGMHRDEMATNYNRVLPRDRSLRMMPGVIVGVINRVMIHRLLCRDACR
jgi:hypothetical protein